MLALRSLRSVRGSALRLAPLGAGALRPLATESYTDRMDKTGRPVSPHVTIYKFPVEALSSITTRITGVLLTIGTSAIGVASLGGAEVPALVAAFQSSAPVLVPAAKFVVVYPLSYHWLSALRHTWWDMTVTGLALKTVHTTSLALFAGAGVISLGLAAI